MINSMSKKQAFLIHLGFSLLIFIILLWMIVYVWYPAPYFDAEYRMKWIKIIAFVDLVLGPGLTLIVFKPGKPSLKMDMSVILIFQTVALSWGVYNAWSAHPKAIVYYDNQVYCLSDKELKEAGADKSFANSPVKNEISAILPYPETAAELKRYLSSGDSTQPMVFRMGGDYIPATMELTQEFRAQKPIDAILTGSEKNAKAWNRFMLGYTEVSPDWRYYPFFCFEDNRMLVFEKSKNKVLDVLDIELPLNFILN